MIDADVYPSHGPQIVGLIAKKASGLPEHTGINDRAIELVNANEFMRLSKSPVSAPIFLDRESDGSLWLCVNYRSLNNLTIAMSALMARMITVPMISLTLLDKLGKV